MSVSYGEQMLARAESKRRVRGVRKRLVLLAPGAAVVLWSTADLIAARHARLDALGAGVIRMTIDHVQPLVWSIAFVLAPLAAALGRHALTAGIALAVLAGPVMTPSLFGAGGWKPWQITVLSMIAVLVLGGAVERSRR